MTDATPGKVRPAPSHPLTPLAVIAAACAIAAPLTLASEGMVRTTYRDPVGILTACAGHTGAGVIVGKTYTDAQCQAFLQADLASHGQAIAACLKVPIPLKTRAAFTDFALNAGSGAFCNSTMARKVNAGDVAGGCAGLAAWIYAGGRVFPGLVTRRAAERKLCEAGLAGL